LRACIEVAGRRPQGSDSVFPEEQSAAQLSALHVMVARGALVLCGTVSPPARNPASPPPAPSWRGLEIEVGVDRCVVARGVDLSGHCPVVREEGSVLSPQTPRRNTAPPCRRGRARAARSRSSGSCFFGPGLAGIGGHARGSPATSRGMCAGCDRCLNCNQRTRAGVGRGPARQPQLRRRSSASSEGRPTRPVLTRITLG
jgi:hypothetical protein